MNRYLSAPIIISIVLLIAILAGEALVCTSGHGDYSSDVSASGGGLDFNLSGRGSHVFDIVVMDGSEDSPKDVSIYFDPSYAERVEHVNVAVGGRALDQQYYAEQLVSTLTMRGVQNVRIVDAAGLSDLMASPGKGHAVVCISGALPDTVYDGTADSDILEWIGSGGRLYWAGNVIGKYVSTTYGTAEVAGGTSLFLGSECIGDGTKAYDKLGSNGLCDALSLLNNNIRYTVDPSKLPEGASHLETGYSDGTQSSISLVGLGDGFVCIFGGDYSNFQRIDMAQTIASGISPSTVLVDHVHGSVSGNASATAKAGEHAYVFFGGYFAVYGELHGVA